VGQPVPAQAEPQQPQQQQPPQSTAPTPTGKPSASPSSAGKPQGRPAPAQATAPARAQPTPPGSRAEDALQACAQYKTAFKDYAAAIKAPRTPKISNPKLIKLAKACRQAPQLAPSKDGTVQADTNLQQIAIDATACTKSGVGDPLVGNDDPKLPLVACD